MEGDVKERVLVGTIFFVHESCLQRGEKKRALVIFFYSIS